VSRVQLALNVADVEAAVEFYSKLFATDPAKRRPGYANFAIADPPLKLVLIEVPPGMRRAEGALNHLGVEVETTEEVKAATARLAVDGFEVSEEAASMCCYAVQDKVWVYDPDLAPWEVYTVLADAPEAESLGCATDGCSTESSRTASAACC